MTKKLLSDKQLLNYLQEFKDGKISAGDLLFNENFSVEDKHWFAKKIEQYLDDTRAERMSGNYEPVVDIIYAPQTIRTWGTPNLDNNFTPIADHHLIIIAGKYGDGKTAYTMFLAKQNAKTIPVEYISLEMTKDDIITRIARNYAGITIPEWRDKSTIPKQKINAYLKKKREIISNHNLSISGLAEQPKTAKDICNYLTITKPKLAIIDNLGLIDKDFPAQSELDLQNSATKSFMNFSKNFNIPIILVHHLNKNNDIRGSEKIKDNASIVIRLKRTFQNNDDVIYSPADTCKSVLSITKDRDFGNLSSQEIFFHKGDFFDDFQQHHNNF